MFARQTAEAFAEAVERIEVQIAGTPLQSFDAVEVVVLQALDEIGRERFRAIGDAERAVVQVTTGAAGNLRQFGRRKIAIDLTVEFAGGGEGDMVDVEVEAHANSVSGDEKIHFAGLEKRDLGVARARAECADDNGGTAALAAKGFCQLVDLGS